MKLIRKTRKEKNKNGRWIYYGIFLCSFCLQEVERQLSSGKRCKSCGCQQYSKERNKKVSESKKGKNNPQFGKKGEKSPSFGKKVTEETRLKIRNKAMGREVLEETRQKMSKYRKGKWIGKDNPMYGKKRELSPNWNGGSSFEIYPKEFNKEFKQFIKNRDLNICQTPGCMNTENLCIHHIDYDKKNNNPENLITLCGNCHCKTNVHNREYWTNYYSEIVSVYL